MVVCTRNAERGAVVADRGGRVPLLHGRSHDHTPPAIGPWRLTPRTDAVSKALEWPIRAPPPRGVLDPKVARHLFVRRPSRGVLPMRVHGSQLHPAGPATGDEHGWGRVGRWPASADGRGRRTASCGASLLQAPVVRATFGPDRPRRAAMRNRSSAQPVSAAADDCLAPPHVTELTMGLATMRRSGSCDACAAARARDHAM
jgi:hypothetical protein